MAKVYFGLGTNLGDKKENLNLAVRKIGERIGKITSLSSFYTTEPWGFDSVNTFLNAACSAESVLSPMEILLKTQEIEKELGRIQKSVCGIYSDRPIDIDLLIYGNLKLTSDFLTLPHPLMTKRLFVMEPLVEIAPELIHPVSGKTIKELYEILIR